MDIVLKTFSRHYLYGTYTDTSPVDYKTIFLPTAREILLNIGEEKHSTAFPIDEEGKINERTECTSLRSFFADLQDGGINAIEILFTTRQKTTVETPLWHDIAANRHRLIQPNVERLFFNTLKHATLYTDVTQLKQPVEELREFLVNQHKLCNEDRFMDKYAYFFTQMTEKYPEVCSITQAYVNAGQPTERLYKSFKIIDTKISFNHRMSIALRTVNNLHKRFCTTRTQPGDWPNLTRLYRTGSIFLEIAHTGGVQFDRPDAELLRAMLDGNIPVEACQELIARNNAELKTLAEAGKLPRLDRLWMDDFVCSAYRSHINQGYSDDLQSNRIHQGYVPECV